MVLLPLIRAKAHSYLNRFSDIIINVYIWVENDKNETLHYMLNRFTTFRIIYFTYKYISAVAYDSFEESQYTFIAAHDSLCDKIDSIFVRMVLSVDAFIKDTIIPLRIKSTVDLLDRILEVATLRAVIYLSVVIIFTRKPDIIDLQNLKEVFDHVHSPDFKHASTYRYLCPIILRFELCRAVTYLMSTNIPSLSIIFILLWVTNESVSNSKAVTNRLFLVFNSIMSLNYVNPLNYKHPIITHTYLAINNTFSNLRILISGNYKSFKRN